MIIYDYMDKEILQLLDEECIRQLDKEFEGHNIFYIRGFCEGYREEMLRNLKCVMKNLELSFDQAAAALKFSPEKQALCRKLLDT